jgi:hypothetical protein
VLAGFLELRRREIHSSGLPTNHSYRRDLLDCVARLKGLRSTRKISPSSTGEVRDEGAVFLEESCEPRVSDPRS